MSLPGASLALHTGVVSDDVITVNGRRVLLRTAAAREAGLGLSTWVSYASRGLPRANPVPKPDGHIDRRTPYWLPETIEAWLEIAEG